MIEFAQSRDARSKGCFFFLPHQTLLLILFFGERERISFVG